MRYTITIDTDNAAFQGAGQCRAEIARILRNLASRCNIDGELVIGSLRDLNGNIVGSAVYGPIPPTTGSIGPRF